MNDNNGQIVIAELIQKGLDGLLTDKEFSSLQKSLNDDPEALNYYVRTMLAISAFSANSIVPSCESVTENDPLSDILSKETWETLAEYEESAPAIEIPEEKPPKELIQKVVYPPQEKSKISKFKIIFLAMNAAAVLFFVLFLKLVPVQSGVEVATLIDSINAKWADNVMMHKGTRLLNDEYSYLLQEGYVKLEFDSHATVVIEAPAEFRILAEDRIGLRYGKVFSSVPPEAAGFSVYTPVTKIVDLGTEFGIQADIDGDTQLHVFQGKTLLLMGNEDNVEVTKGIAKKVSGDSEKVADIPLSTTRFVQKIDSERGFIWKGKKSIDLADIVGGGNGFGTGQEVGEIDPGGDERYWLPKSGGPFYTDNTYRSCAELPFVDGVFVPDGGVGPVQISSQGHMWQDCPDTTGVYFEGIYTGEKSRTGSRHGFVLQGQRYGVPGRPHIATHGNTGVTFDLGALRNQMPGLKIIQFTALCGVSQTVRNRTSGNVSDFYVLVDGEKRFEAKRIGVLSEPRQVSVELRETDSFLTLVCTDGDLKPHVDWSFYGNPRLVLESR